MVQRSEPSAREGDVALVRRCQQGDREAQRALFRAHFDRLYATLIRITGNDVETEDLAQEAFFAAFRSLGTYDGRARFSTWLEAIAVRVTFRRVKDRRHKRLQLERLGFEGYGQGTGPEPEQALQAREGLRRLHVLLDRLSPTTRLAFALHAIDGRPLDEVGRLLRVPTVTAKLRVWRARKVLNEAARGDELLAAYLEGVAATRGVPGEALEADDAAGQSGQSGDVG